MNVPTNLKYTNDHEWVKVDGNVATVGITDFAQSELGDIVFVDIQTEGEELGKGEVFGAIEAVKTVADAFMPVSGKVIEVNADLEGKFFHTSGVKFLQFVMCWLLFTVMYIAIPNTKVRLMSALIPGVLMGTLFQLLQMLSVYLIALLSRTSIVYGAFASLPILLTWLQYTSLLILIGAEMSYAIQNNEQFEYEHDLNRMSRRYKDFVMLYLLSVIIRRFESDEAPLTAHELAVRDKLPIRLVNQLLSRMVENGILREVHVEGNEEKTYQPALDTHKISVGMVIERTEAQGTEHFLQAPTAEMRAFWENYMAAKAKNNHLNEILVNEL